MTNAGVIGPEIDPSRIAQDVVIHAGSRISGKKTSIGPGCEIGAEGPVSLDNCQLARDVKLKGGFFSGSVFLDGSSMGGGAHVREGTILEEDASGAHSVGLKQTLLFPFVTLGSLINFCDILMAGGTSRKHHSEVGSSYVHFNFTPNQDKATASLVGDVPRGVLLRQKPVFLGGQGGLVGPARIAYGSVIAAGGICRSDLLVESQLHIPAVPMGKTLPYEAGVYKNIERIVNNNLIYIGNLQALKAWYQNVRVLFLRDEFDRACHEGALSNLNLILKERIQRLEQLAGIVSKSVQGSASTDCCFSSDWKTIRCQLEQSRSIGMDAVLHQTMSGLIQYGYITAIQNLSDEMCHEITAWLQSIVDVTASLRN